MRYLWMGIALACVMGLDPGLALASCQTWTIYEQGKTKICQQCCQMGNCTLTCY